MEKQKKKIFALQQDYFKCYQVLLEKFGEKNFSGKEGWETLRNTGYKYKMFHFFVYNNIFEKVGERREVKSHIFKIKSDLLVVNAYTRDIAYMVNSFFKEKQRRTRRYRAPDEQIGDKFLGDRFSRIKKIEAQLEKKQQALQLIKQLIK